MDRAELLRENIRVQQEELAHLESTTAMTQRMQASATALGNFRVNVQQQRDQLARIEEQIASGLATLEFNCYTWHTKFQGRGLHDPAVRSLIEGSAMALAQLILGRYRQQDSLKQVEVALEGMERVAQG